MTTVCRALERLDHHYPYIAIGAAISTVVGIALSSVILKVAGVALAAIALFGYIHQKCFTSSHSPVQPINHQLTAVQQIVPEVEPLIEGTSTSEITALSETTQEPTHITDSITSEEQIHTLASINGISIQEIEKRARPEKHPTGPNQTVETQGWSFSGFLGMEESFKEVLLGDWKTVRQLGWTHEDLANHLGNIADAVRFDEHNIEVQLNYNYSDREKPGQDLTALYVVHRGTQEDIFSPVDDARYNGWGRQCWITNTSTGAKVIWTPGVERYIQKYGFYEGGGKQNKYRVDPIALISILTGESEAVLRKKLTLG